MFCLYCQVICRNLRLLREPTLCRLLSGAGRRTEQRADDKTVKRGFIEVKVGFFKQRPLRRIEQSGQLPARKMTRERVRSLAFSPVLFRFCFLGQEAVQPWIFRFSKRRGAEAQSSLRFSTRHPYSVPFIKDARLNLIFFAAYMPMQKAMCLRTITALTVL